MNTLVLLAYYGAGLVCGIAIGMVSVLTAFREQWRAR